MMKKKNVITKLYRTSMVLFTATFIFTACFPAKKPVEITTQEIILISKDNQSNELVTVLNTSSLNETLAVVSTVQPVQEIKKETLAEGIVVQPVQEFIKETPAESIVVQLAQEPISEAISQSANSTDIGNTIIKQPSALPVYSNFILIPAGFFQMGSNEDPDEAPVHLVYLNLFYIGKYEVSQKEYAEITRKNLIFFKGDDFPVENISWYDAIEYCNQLSVKEGLQPAYQGEEENITCNFKASGYRLPTEAEWGYAAYGKDKTKYAGSDDAETVAWYNNNSYGMSHIVGTKAANSLGLFDMSGNVSEWCWDLYGTYSNENQNNPTGASDGKTRVVRGGFFGNNELNLRLTTRNHHSPVMRNSSVGFRIVRSVL
jgi:formylglycine-generating enzyme required for sulfatase activity